MKARKRIGHLLLTAALVVAISACGSSSKEGEAAGTSGKTAAETVRLSFMTTWSETDPYSSFYYDLVMEFMKQNPDIKIDIQMTPYIDYPVKLSTSAAGNQLADLILMIRGGSQLESMVHTGLLMPIDEVMNRWPEDYLKADLIQDFNVDGKQYGIPSEISYHSIIFYNQKILKDAGYSSFPASFEEFEKLIMALKAKGITPISVGNAKGAALMDSYLSPLNAKISGKGVYEALLSGQKKFTDADFVASLEKIKELFEMGAFNVDLNNIDNVQATDLFLTGHSAIYIDGNWAVKQISSSKAEDFEVGFALFPQVEGGKGDVSVTTGATNMAIALNAKLDETEKEAAVKFLDFMYSEQAYQSVIRAGNLVPANVAVPEDLDPLFQEMSEALKNVAEVYKPFLNAMPPAVNTAAQNGLQGLTVKNGPTPDELAKTLQKELE
ncbi:ABC transporter substrate-binding protein [Cohnella cellulosilytica]|uniref:ABC transporter substrate-binding protein n=1 Tax=Cohnella cellulosilytica TaxID=986710 RepID=A0ABW2F4I6_9BACL